MTSTEQITEMHGLPLKQRESPLLRVRELHTHFPISRGVFRRATGWCCAVDGVSLEINRGTTLGLVGESGCGKTTLGRTLLRLIPATSGRVLFDGIDWLALSGGRLREMRRHMQLIFQDPLGSLNPRMTIGDSITEPLRIHREVSRGKRDQRAEEFLERVGLQPAHLRRYPHEFSGGQRQRVGIARALALSPQLIICDEPVSALDVSVQAQILNLLGDLQRTLGLAYLFISHNLSVVKQVSDRMAVMYLGRIVEIADAGDLFVRPRHPYTIALLAAVPDHDTAGRCERSVPRGELPHPAERPSGCGFHPRCPLATEECRHTSPPLQNHAGMTTDHLVACHHFDRVGTLRFVDDAKDQQAAH